MTVSRIIEFSAGVVTALLAGFIYCYGVNIAFRGMSRDQTFSLRAVLFSFLFFVGPAACLLIGSYTHSVKQKTWGYLLLLVSAAVTDFIILASVLGGIGFFYPGWVMLLMLGEFIAVLIAVVAAIWSNRDLDAMLTNASEG
jgi:ABC-type antimicrobial peptide transport system permease subunit